MPRTRAEELHLIRSTSGNTVSVQVAGPEVDSGRVGPRASRDRVAQLRGKSRLAGSVRPHDRDDPSAVTMRLNEGENPCPGQLKPPSAVKLMRLGDTITNAAAVGAVAMRPMPLLFSSHALVAIAAAHMSGSRLVATVRP